MGKRVISFLLAFVMLVGILPISAHAADPVSMMISYAEDRLGKTGQELGYGDKPWCAFFVSDCAAYAGQSNAIPYNGYVPTMYSDLLKKAGGKRVQSPQPGDLIFYNCTACDTDNDGFALMHVGLVGYDGYSIEGNRSNKAVKKKLTDSYSDGIHSTANGVIKRIYVRPAYQGVAAQPLTPPTVTTARTTYKSGTNVSVNWNAISGNDFYQINVYRNGVLILDQSMGQSTSYTLNNAQVGDYTVYVSANNSAGSFCSTACIFTVKDISIPAKPTVSTEKTSYYQGNDVVVNWTAVSGNEYYWINVYRDGNIILDKTMDGATSYTLESIQPGSYEIWVSANNLAGSSGSAIFAFTVAEVKPQVQRWITYTEFGDPISSGNYELGKNYHLCYKLLEGNSGNRLDDIDNYTYQVKLTWYGADGKVFVTNTFENDANSINMPITQPGVYRWTIEIGGDFIHSDEGTLDVKAPCVGGHKWDTGKMNTPATENTEGVKTFTCTTCGETKTESIPKLPHSYTSKVTAPTCTEKGYTTHTCACGDKKVDTYVDALGHKWDDGKVTKEPTEKEEGIKTFTCSACKNTKTEPIAKLPPHAHQHTAKVTAPTCTEKGFTTHTCTCGDSYVDSYVDPVDHTWGEGVVEKEPTEAENGFKAYYCKVCGAIKGEPMDKLPHSYTATVTPPTCTEKGYTTHTCACGDKKVDTYVNATGHKWNSGKITKEPTEKSEGVKTFTCLTCGNTRTESVPKLEAKPSIAGMWTTDLVMPAAELGVHAPDSVLRATLTFTEDGKASASWEAVDLTAFKVFFHDMFVSSYYAMAYGAGITDIQQIEQFCMDSTGLSVSAYMDTIVTDEAMKAAFTPPSTQGTYRYAPENKAIFTDLALMDVPSDPNVPNTFTVENGQMHLNAASYGKPDYTFVCKK